MSATEKKVAGAITYIKGKLQRILGGLTGSRSVQAKGYGNQAQSGATYGMGKAQEPVDKLHES